MSKTGRSNDADTALAAVASDLAELEDDTSQEGHAGGRYQVEHLIRSCLSQTGAADVRISSWRPGEWVAPWFSADVVEGQTGASFTTIANEQWQIVVYWCGGAWGVHAGAWLFDFVADWLGDVEAAEPDEPQVDPALLGDDEVAFQQWMLERALSALAASQPNTVAYGHALREVRTARASLRDERLRRSELSGPGNPADMTPEEWAERLRAFAVELVDEDCEIFVVELLDRFGFRFKSEGGELSVERAAE